MATRAVTYARVSSDDHSKGGLNLAGQQELCSTFALNKGYTIVAELAEDEVLLMYPDGVVIQTPPPKFLQTVRVKLVPVGPMSPRVDCSEYEL